MPKKVVEQEATLKKVNELYLLEIDIQYLKNRSSVKTVVCIHDHCFKSFAFRSEEKAECVIPYHELEKLHLQVGSVVRFTLQTLLPNKKVSIPSDLQEALARAGVMLETLPKRQQWQLIMMVRESNTKEIRKSRIAAAISACKKLAK